MTVKVKIMAQPSKKTKRNKKPSTWYKTLLEQRTPSRATTTIQHTIELSSPPPSSFKNYTLASPTTTTKIKQAQKRKRRKPPNAYNLFMSDTKLSLHEAGKQWQTLDASTKQLYQNRALLERQQYNIYLKQKQKLQQKETKTSISGRWKERYIQLQNFIAQHGSEKPVPYKTEYRKLYTWIARQRQLYHQKQQQQHPPQNEEKEEENQNWCRGIKQYAITSEQINALNQLNFTWETLSSYSIRLPKNETFEDRYNELCDFVMQYNHCHVPYPYEENPKLSLWVRSIRREYQRLNTFSPTNNAATKVNDHHYLQRKKGNSTRDDLTLTPERIEALLSIGYIFDRQQLSNDKWNKRYNELCTFKSVYNHCNVPKSYNSNPQLGTWVENQRTQYRLYTNATLRHRSTLTKERLKALDSIGFQVNKQSYDWYTNLYRLKEYMAAHDNSCVIPYTDVEHRELRQWVDRQRIGYSEWKRGVPFSSIRMTEERMEELNRIGFVWNLREEKKRKKMEERQKLREEEEEGMGGGGDGPTSEDWSALFESMKEKGINAKPKAYWMDGVDELSPDELGDLTDEDLMDLWNEEDDEDDDDW